MQEHVAGMPTWSDPTVLTSSESSPVVDEASDALASSGAAPADTSPGVTGWMSLPSK